jgi:hypothetical protein
MNDQYYLGIDLHRHYFSYYATDKTGQELLRGRLINSLESVDKLSKAFSLPPT